MNDPANFFTRLASAIKSEERQAVAQAKTEPTRDDRICAICDGGPGNQGVCLCGHHAYGEANVRDHQQSLASGMSSAREAESVKEAL
jgi:hypothetical protein